MNALAFGRSRASINLMPLSIWKELSLPALTKTPMILELADRMNFYSYQHRRGCFRESEHSFILPIFVVVDYVADPRVPLILGRPFLRTARALIDVHGEQMTLRHDDQSVTFKWQFPTSTSEPYDRSRLLHLSLTFEEVDFLMEEIENFLKHDDSIPPVLTQSMILRDYTVT
ncbi:reverse transcriptase domain-containing protein [Tanacetum coccineum]